MQKSLIISLFLWLQICYAFSAGVKRIYKGKDDGQITNKSKVKLYVFGDSYADTGNWDRDVISWKVPYGRTFPGSPTGRFSDGRILTDYIASHFKIESPIPYEQWNKLSEAEKLKKLEFGMNYAYGGTGVLDTDIPRPNITAQIGILESLIKHSKVISSPDLDSSLALVSVSGNDYANFLRNPTNQTVAEFAKSLINQLTTDLERIQSLGVKKIAVTKMEPIGCIPVMTFVTEYTSCAEKLNEVALSHNSLLQKSVDILNSKTKDTTFFALDLYGAFMSSLQPGNPKSVDLLKPCCQGLTSDDACGTVEGNVAKYTVCNKPRSAFFWDEEHPAEHGWYQVYMAIQPTLKQIY